MPQLPRPQFIPPSAEQEEATRMGLLDHLDELRRRLTRAFLALALGTTLAFFITEPVFRYLLEPYCFITGGECRLQTLGPTEGVIAFFRVALMLGAILSIPVMTYQLMLFILPGLTSRERRYIFMALPAITLLFIVGVLFAWFGLIPPAIGFLEGFAPNLFRPEWTADLYLSFVTALLFWMGVAFQTPLIFFVLALLGLVETAFLRNNWRVAVVISSIAAALITPTVDPVNMFLVMGPLLMLYTISIFLVALGRRIAGLR